MTRLHHVQLAMPRGAERQAEAFYSGVLGLEPVAKPEHLQARGGCWFRLGGGLELHLGVEEPFSPARKAHPALAVDDLDAVRRALEAEGYTIVADSQLAGYERFYTADPFGNRIEILAEA